MGLPGVSPLFPSKPVINPVVPQTVNFGKRQIEQVNGFDGANTVPMGPNESCIFPDANMDVIWVVVVDGTGALTVKGVNVCGEYIPPKPVTMEDLLAEMKAMNERLMRVEGSNGSVIKHTGTSQPDGAGNATGTADGAGAAIR